MPSPLTPEQQVNLNKQKIDIRIENEQYLREHPEVGLLLQKFYEGILIDKPQNTVEYITKWFTRPDLRQKVHPN
ncbi:hypothetical protein PROFUN_15368 [Planoprotostelium fungivorum]|uniref:RIIa domain-containing protein n=1 Tax=Planoprotostelium fungivorum TaxID=1890364 RepID=A0A2P6MW35_9EUKA|nr:hypothetical protein PROFUN_15368 [Planoprotostelium fungivorum]